MLRTTFNSIVEIHVLWTWSEGVPGMTQAPPFQPRGWNIYGPPFPDGRTTPTRQGFHWKRWAGRKHEVEPVYVANSESAIWCWGEGRADPNRQDLISGIIELTWSRTEYGEVVRLTQGSPTCPVVDRCCRLQKANLPTVIPKASWDRGWQIHG